MAEIRAFIVNKFADLTVAAQKIRKDPGNLQVETLQAILKEAEFLDKALSDLKKHSQNQDEFASLRNFNKDISELIVETNKTFVKYSTLIDNLVIKYKIQNFPETKDPNNDTMITDDAANTSNLDNTTATATKAEVKFETIIKYANKISGTTRCPENWTEDLELPPTYSLPFPTQEMISSGLLYSNLDPETRVPDVKINPGSEFVREGQELFLTCDDPRAELYYCFGEEQIPNQFLGSLYDRENRPKIIEDTIVRCIACRAGMKNSLMVSQKFLISPHAANIPVDPDNQNMIRPVIRPIETQNSHLDLSLGFGTPLSNHLTSGAVPGGDRDGDSDSDSSSD